MNPFVRLWLYRGIYVFIGLIVIALPLLPLGFLPSRMAMPDLLFALTIVWIIRDTRTAPLLLVAGLALLADAVLMRPVGLWALLVVVATELARMNDRLLRDGGIIAELVFFAASMVIMLMIQNMLLFLTFSNTYPLNRVVQIVMLSLICYPFFVLFLHYVMRVRGVVSKDTPDRLGRVG